MSQTTTFTGEPVVQDDGQSELLTSALDVGQGLLRLAPDWILRGFLHPRQTHQAGTDQLYACGSQRGGIDERWFAGAYFQVQPFVR